MKNSESMRSIEEKVGSAYENVKVSYEHNNFLCQSHAVTTNFMFKKNFNNYILSKNFNKQLNLTKKLKHKTTTRTYQNEKENIKTLNYYITKILNTYLNFLQKYLRKLYNYILKEFRIFFKFNSIFQEQKIFEKKFKNFLQTEKFRNIWKINNIF